MEKKNILILGGSRFIGYLMLSELIKRKYNVTIFNRQLTVPPAPFPAQTKFIKGDRNCLWNLKKVFNQQYETVIDISGYNVDHIRPIIKEYSSKIGHYIFISTAEVYEDKFNNLRNEESSRTFIKNTYAGDKALAEDAILSSKNDLPITIFRPSGVFGPHDPCIAGQFFYRILNNFPIFIGENVNVRVNHLFVFDLILAIKLAIGNPKAFGKAYNIVGDEKPNLKEFIDICGKVSSSTPFVKREKNIMDQEVVNFVRKKRFANFFSDWPKIDKIYSNSLVKKDLKMNFTSLENSLYKTYLWLTEDRQRLNYFSIRGERYILYNLPIPFYKKYLWKIVDLFYTLFIKFRKSLSNIVFLRKIYYRFKNFAIII